MRLKLVFLFALWLPEVPLDLAMADGGSSLWHPLGFDGLGRDGLLRLAVGAARSMGFASAAALTALVLGAAMALGKERLGGIRSVMRTLPPVLLILPVADRFTDIGWLSLALILAFLLSFHAEPALRSRFEPMLRGCAIPSARTLGADRLHVARVWFPWVVEELKPLFPSLWLDALWSEVLIRFLGLGPGPHRDSFGLLLNQEMLRAVTDPTPLGIAVVSTVIALACWASPGKEHP